MEVEKINDLYLSYNDFKSNYDNDFKEWQIRFPDSIEIDYLRYIDKQYKETLSFFQTHSEGDYIVLEEFVSIYEVDRLGNSLDYIASLDEYAGILRLRLHCFIKDESNENIYKILRSERSLIYGSKLDKYNIEPNVHNIFYHFLKVNEKEQVCYDRDKFKNFEISINRIFDFISEKNKTTYNKTESVSNNITNKIIWKDNKNNLLELFKTLKVVGKIDYKANNDTELLDLLNKYFEIKNE
ncbi:hypothetical protein [Capnocytophaga gingivalis]